MTSPARIGAGIGNTSNAARYAKWDIDFFCNAVNPIFRHTSSVGTRCDVVENQFVGALLLIPPGLLDGIAGIDVVKELYALDHPAFIDIETGDDAFGEQG